MWTFRRVEGPTVALYTLSQLDLFRSDDTPIDELVELANGIFNWRADNSDIAQSLIYIYAMQSVRNAAMLVAAAQYFGVNLVRVTSLVTAFHYQPLPFLLSLLQSEPWMNGSSNRCLQYDHFHFNATLNPDKRVLAFTRDWARSAYLVRPSQADEPTQEEIDGWNNLINRWTMAINQSRVVEELAHTPSYLGRLVRDIRVHVISGYLDEFYRY